MRPDLFYHPSAGGDVATAAVLSTWSKLDPAERYAIAVTFKPVVRYVSQYTTTQGLGVKGVAELAGKLGTLLHLGPRRHAELARLLSHAMAPDADNAELAGKLGMLLARNGESE